ncbi:MAG: SRPBCC family protein [Hyphomicrobiales bacterium]|nr:SRPBCC family protein [Hyphomicrobiales bacterium]
MRIALSLPIDAPAELVFATISDIQAYAKAVPHIEDIAFLSETRTGLGTRFRETRRTGGTVMTTELEVTEFVENARQRLVADSHGAVWDTLFVVAPRNGASELSVTMEARAYAVLAKLAMPAMKSAIGEAIERDMAAVKAYCERLAGQGRAPEAKTA